MKKLDLLFIDDSIKGFERYAVPISGIIKNMNNTILIGACYFEQEEPFNLDFFDCVFCARDFKLDISRILDSYNPSAIVVFAYRIFDYIFTVEAHKRGIKVFNFQHALYRESENEALSNGSLFIKIKHKFKMLTYYLPYIGQLIKENSTKAISILYAFGKYKTMSQVFYFLYKEKCNADISYVYGRFWIGYYNKNYLENNSKFEVVGYPELEQPSISINSLEISNAFPTICYLAETTAESASNYWDIFVTHLEEVLPEINLIIKFHPRSDRSMYRVLFESKYSDHVFVWQEKAFPRVKYYLGHESTVLSRALDISDTTLICRVDVNRESPYEKYSKYVVCDSNDLKMGIQKMLKGECDNRKLEDISDFSKKNTSVGALNQTAISIINEIVNLNSCDRLYEN